MNFGTEWRGTARPGQVWQGRVWQGTARLNTLCSLGSIEVWQGQAGLGPARQGNHHAGVIPHSFSTK